MICCSLPKLVASNQLRHVQSPFIWLKGENILCPDGTQTRQPCDNDFKGFREDNCSRRIHGITPTLSLNKQVLFTCVLITQCTMRV